MGLFKRFKYLDLNTVLLARHFQYRVEILFKVILVDGQLGKVKYHVTRAEFQNHSLICMDNRCNSS